MVARLEPRDADRLPEPAMNTVLLLPGLFSSQGGIERMLRLYVRAVGELAQPTDRVDVIVWNDSPADAGKLAPYRTPQVASFTGCRRNRLTCVWQTIRHARRSQRLICGHVNLLRLAHLARKFSSQLEIWLVAHGIEVWRAFTTAERRALRATERILCVSDYTRRQLASHCPGLTPSQLTVLPNALDPEIAAAAEQPGIAQPGLILAVARLDAAEAYKGIDHLIAAMPAVRAVIPAARLRVVGDGNDRPRLENLAAGMNGGVEFRGRVTDAELRQHLDACQLFALPSGGEGFGLVYLEAMAHGKPCVAANAGGAPEVVNPASGRLVPYGDITALSAACVAALQAKWNPALLRARAMEFSYEAFRRRLAAHW
jgi:phosphatidylinositol alpha-1,6-mannosyltransferase